MHRGTNNPGLVALFTLFCGLTLAIAGCVGKETTRTQAIERHSLELREAVSSNVPEQDRKSRMLSIVEQVATLNRRFDRETAEFVESYRKLNADYDSPRPAFDQLFADYNAKRIKARSEALELHLQLASLATGDEWDAIGKAEVELYEEVDTARPAKESTK